MNWRKTVFQENNIWVLSILVIFFCIFGVLTVSPYLLFIGGLYGVFLFLNFLYDKHSGKSLILKNDKNRKRYFIGDEGELELNFFNSGLPIINGTLEIYFNKSLHGKYSEEITDLQRYQNIAVKVPLTIRRGQELRITVPFIAMQRGIGRVTKISLTYHNLFGFNRIMLDHSPIWNEEYIVYPDIVPVNKINIDTLLKEGNQISKSSLFEDRLMMAGTRDYMPGDSFQRIHWKASAKMNRLQTKVFEKITDTSLLITINAAEGYWLNADIEAFLSRIAHLAEFAYKQNIPISVITNIRSHGSIPFLYVPFGEGRDQYIKILEMLALIDTHQMIIPYEKLLYYLFSHRVDAPYLIHAGLLTDNHKHILKNIAKRGTNLYKLDLAEDYSSVAAL